ncbi:MAG: hypothetical protein WC553_02345 [Patescibacteria group bacterium]
MAAKTHYRLLQRPVWMTLTRSCDDVASYIAMLERDGHCVETFAQEIMSETAFKAGFEINTVEVGEATGRELTNKRSPTLAEIFTGISNIGGGLLPAWAGPELCKQCHNQSRNVWRFVAMEPIRGILGFVPFIFGVGHSNQGHSLWATPGFPSDHFQGGRRWMFRRKCPCQLDVEI